MKDLPQVNCLSNEKTASKSAHLFESYDATDRHRRQAYNTRLFTSGVIKYCISLPSVIIYAWAAVICKVTASADLHTSIEECERKNAALIEVHYIQRLFILQFSTFKPKSASKLDMTGAIVKLFHHAWFNPKVAYVFIA